MPPPWLWAQGKTQKQGPCPGKKAKCPSQGDSGLGAFAMAYGIWEVGFGCGSGEHVEAQGTHWCSGGRMKTQLQFHCQGGLRNRRNLPCLMLGSKHIASCQHQPPSRSCASSGAGRAAGEGLHEVAACPCKPQASRAPRQQRRLLVQDVPNMPFLPLCHLELPINPEQGTAWPGSRSTAVPDGASSCAASREEGFSPNSSMDALPTATRGMHCHPIDGNTALAAAGEPGMQKNQSPCRDIRTLLCALLGTPRQGSGTVCRQQALLASCAPTPFPGLAGIQASFCWYRKCITQLRGSPLPGQRAGKDRGYFQPVFPGWNPTGINFTAGRALI